MALKTYDPKKISIIFFGIPLEGFADGTFVSATRSNDSFTKTSGADGIVSRSKSNDTGAEVTVTLAQTSTSNAILSGFMIADELKSAGAGPLIIKDSGGSTLFFAAAAWIRKPADITNAKEIENREWIFDTADSAFFVGGTD
jgi:hypothetical protein